MTTDYMVCETEEVIVETSEPDSNEFLFWRLDEDMESKIEALRNWERKVTCRTLCSCYPAQALQVCELSISTKEDRIIASSQAYIFGSFAIRDHYDRRRINIFNRERTNPVRIDFSNGVGKVRITNPRRGILYGNLAFDYDLNVIYTTLEGYKKEEKINGKALYNGKKHPYSSRPETMRASIPIKNDSNMKEINLKFIRFPQGIEAGINIEPPEGLNFRLTARMGDLPNEIIVFDSKYDMPRGDAYHNSLKFVLVVPCLDILELKYTEHNQQPDEQPKICTFNSLYHGFISEVIILKYGTIKMEIKWSRM